MTNQEGVHFVQTQEEAQSKAVKLANAYRNPVIDNRSSYNCDCGESYAVSITDFNTPSLVIDEIIVACETCCEHQA